MLASLLIEHHLDFQQDWLHANSSFRMGRVDDPEITSCRPSSRPPGISTIISRLAPQSSGLLSCRGSWWLSKSITSSEDISPRTDFRFRTYSPWPSEPPSTAFWESCFRFELAKKYLAGALGVPGNLGDLVRKFSAGLYVLQSFVVSRAFRVYGGTVLLVLGSHPRQIALGLQWLVLGPDLRTDDGCLLRRTRVLLIVPLFESLASYWRTDPISANAVAIGTLFPPKRRFPLRDCFWRFCPR